MYCDAKRNFAEGTFSDKFDYRTIQNINDHYNVEFGANPKKHKSLTNKPMFDNRPGDTKILTILPIASLHVVKLGPTNKLLKTLKQVDEKAHDQFLDDLNISQPQYNGGDLEGNQCSLVLDNAKKLQVIANKQAQIIVEGLDSIRKVL